MTFTVKVTGGARNPFRRYNWPAAARAWADQVGPVVTDALRREAPIGHGPDAGRLRHSIREEQLHISSGRAQLEFASSAPYAGFVLHGTPPHLIRPVRAHALHWMGPEGDMFAQLVHHPGTRPNDFPRRALAPLVPFLQQRLRAAIAEQLKP